jgi:spermidine/putrescine transport system permease protein
MRFKTALSWIGQEKSFFIGVFPFIWQSLFFYAPLLCIVVFSVLLFSDTGALSGITGYNYAFFLNPLYIGIIGKSLLLALVTSALCFLIGYPVAYFISFRVKKFKNIFLFLLILPFFTNFLLHIYAWFFVLECSGFLNNVLRSLGVISQPLHILNSLYAVIILMVYCYLPFMVLPLYSSLERFDRKLLEASADLGATHWQTWAYVMLPLSLPAIESGFFLVFVPSFGEFVIPGLLGGERYMFVGTVISHYVLGNRTLSLGAAFTVLSCLGLLLSIAVLYLLVRRFFTHTTGGSSERAQ